MYKADTETGNTNITIDGKELAMIKDTGEQTWEGYSKTLIVGDDLPFGKHQVAIELLPAKGAKDTGKGFDIIAMAYGNK